MPRRRFKKWGKQATHRVDDELLKEGKRDSICWVKGRRGLICTTDPNRVTCSFCKRIMKEAENVDEGQEA